MKRPVLMDERERATVLAALALWPQFQGEGDGVVEIASDHGRLVPLTDDEVQELAERIGLGDDAGDGPSWPVQDWQQCSYATPADVAGAVRSAIDGAAWPDEVVDVAVHPAYEVRDPHEMRAETRERIMRGLSERLLTPSEHLDAHGLPESRADRRARRIAEERVPGWKPATELPASFVEGQRLMRVNGAGRAVECVVVTVAEEAVTVRDVGGPGRPVAYSNPHMYLVDATEGVSVMRWLRNVHMPPNPSNVAQWLIHNAEGEVGTVPGSPEIQTAADAVAAWRKPPTGCMEGQVVLNDAEDLDEWTCPVHPTFRLEPAPHDVPGRTRIACMGYRCSPQAPEELRE